MSGGNILHFGAARIRVVGTGNLRLTFYGLDDVDSEVLVPLVMASTSGRELTRLSNFIGQRARLKLQTTAINEVMKVNNITIFAKPLWTEFPS